MQHGLRPQTVEAVNAVLSQYPAVQKVLLFGSRAKGTFRPGSDIDLALSGAQLSQREVDRIAQALDDLPTPYEFSLVLLDAHTDRELVSHIERVGQLFYERGRSTVLLRDG